MEKKYLYSISGVCIFLSAWMLLTASKYVFMDDRGKCGIGAFLLGISSIIFTFAKRETKGDFIYT